MNLKSQYFGPGIPECICIWEWKTPECYSHWHFQAIYFSQVMYCLKEFKKIGGGGIKNDVSLLAVSMLVFHMFDLAQPSLPLQILDL